MGKKKGKKGKPAEIADSDYGQAQQPGSSSQGSSGQSQPQKSAQQVSKTKPTPQAASKPPQQQQTQPPRQQQAQRQQGQPPRQQQAQQPQGQPPRQQQAHQPQGQPPQQQQAQQPQGQPPRQQQAHQPQGQPPQQWQAQQPQGQPPQQWQAQQPQGQPPRQQQAHQPQGQPPQQWQAQQPQGQPPQQWQAQQPQGQPPQQQQAHQPQGQPPQQWQAQQPQGQPPRQQQAQQAQGQPPQQQQAQPPGRIWGQKRARSQVQQPSPQYPDLAGRGQLGSAQQQPPQQQQQVVGRGQKGQQGPPTAHQSPQHGSPGKGPSQQQPGSSTGPQQQGSATSIGAGVQPQKQKQELGQGDSTMLAIPHVRHNPGVKGRIIKVETNHIALNLGNLKTAIHYDVNMIPDLPKRNLRRVMETFRLKHFSNRYPAFDGRKNLYSAAPLPFNTYIEDKVTIMDDGKEKEYKVEIKFANYVDLTPLKDLLNSETSPREALQCVDIVLRMAPANYCVPVGRSFFLKPETIIDLGEGMEMYNGLFQSTVRGWRPFLNVDVAHKAFPKAINVTEALMEVCSDFRSQMTRQDLSRPLQGWQREAFASFIKMLRVTYEIPGHPGTRRSYRVNGINDPPSTKQFNHDGQMMTIQKYFELTKNYSLRYPNLPTLWVGSQARATNPILLPMELCTLVEGQPINRKMTENQTSKMIRHAATSTSVRKNKIMAALNKTKHNVHPSVREFNFSIGSEFEKLDARVLDPPLLGYADTKVKPSRGIWRGTKFLQGAEINRWTIMSADRRANMREISKLGEEILKHAGSCGMKINNPPEKPFDILHLNQLKDIREYLQKHNKYDVIFVVVPDRGPQYAYVKTAAEINVGCLTQCIKARTLFKLNPQTIANILLKVNSKLNGTNHCLLQRPRILNKPCMIMGADVTHPGPEAKTIPSVAAVTASHDPKAFKYNICCRLQQPTVEIIDDLEDITYEQLHYFFEKNKCKPETLVFFRDGVSEGQFEQVLSAEVRAIQAACKRVQTDGYEPKITFLVVQKRHHTRLFPLNARDSEDKNLNVPAGTCVDTKVTNPFLQDFYLVSHASIQGVAKPTKYCTLWDDNNMSNDEIEELTYFLCHMFTRCNRSVSYPAPTYYAHLAAARAKVYIENERLNLEQLEREMSRIMTLDSVRKEKPMFFV